METVSLCLFYATNPIIAIMQNIAEMWPVFNWFPEAATTGVTVDPAVSAAAVAPAVELAVESVLLALMVDDDPEDVDPDDLEANPGETVSN